MCTRIRNKVALIHRSDANPADNLSTVDLKISQMLPMVDIDILSNILFQDGSEGTLDVGSSNVDIQNAGETSASRKVGTQIAEETELSEHILNYAEFQADVVIKNGEENEMTNDILEDVELQDENDIQISTVVINNEEELEMYADECLVIEEHPEDINIDDTENMRPKLPKNVEKSLKTVKPLQSAKVNYMK